MFVYLLKKIPFPNGAKLNCLSWDGDTGWISCGGENGLLRVLKLELDLQPPANDSSSSNLNKNFISQPNVSNNQNLKGHTGDVELVDWNETARKLTSSDASGSIIVWTLHKGCWYEEFVNNRKKSFVKDMKWSYDGQRICVAYEDGHVILGTVDGDRIWGRDLLPGKVEVRRIQWTPDSQYILICTSRGQTYKFDLYGNNKGKVPIFEERIPVISLDWYSGAEGFVDPSAPALAVAFENGSLHLMIDEDDKGYFKVSTRLNISAVKWNRQGNILAVSGGTTSNLENCQVNFYSPFGKLLRTLVVPGSHIPAIAWNGSGLKMAFAVDSSIFFSDVRPNYRWGYVESTLVYSFTSLESDDHSVIFWNTKSLQQEDGVIFKSVHKLCGIYSAMKNLLLVSISTDSPDKYVLRVCNALSSEIDSRIVEVEPRYVSLSDSAVVVANDSLVLLWCYALQMVSSSDEKLSRDHIIHIDATPSKTIGMNESTTDPICAICLKNDVVLVARLAGAIHEYMLPSMVLVNRYQTNCRPDFVTLNCDSTRFALIDYEGIMTLYNVNSEKVPIDSRASVLKTVESTVDATAAWMNDDGMKLSFERKDVWNVHWAEDVPDLFAMMEKARMYVLRGLNPEEPIVSSGYICRFKNLKIRAVLLDEIMKDPENPDQEFLVNIETKSFRDVKSMLNAETIPVDDAFEYISSRPHSRLWHLLAETSLKKLQLQVAEKAFIQCHDCQGVQFVKHLKVLNDRKKQKAEILATYFKNYDEAEKLYISMDRTDLAIELRMCLGDWFRVLRLLEDGGEVDDVLFERVQNEIGEYYAERKRWHSALQAFSKTNNRSSIANCYIMLEDYTALQELAEILPPNDPLLKTIAQEFVLVGLSENAAQAYVKIGDVKLAVDCCVYLNNWELAVRLAEEHKFQHIEDLLSQYADHLVEKNKIVDAIRLYRKAGVHIESARLLFRLAENSKSYPRAKYLCVLAALELDRLRVDSSLGENSFSNRDSIIDIGWRAAEAYHFTMMAQRQAYLGYIEASMKTSRRLEDYEDILDVGEIQSFCALVSFCNKHYDICSRSFTKLENLDVDQELREGYEKLALDIFTRYSPNDPITRRKIKCPNCESEIKDWCISCPSCNTKFPACVITGRSILDNRYIVCHVCRHSAIESEKRAIRNCPLCYHPY